MKIPSQRGINSTTIDINFSNHRLKTALELNTQCGVSHTTCQHLRK